MHLPKRRGGEEDEGRVRPQPRSPVHFAVLLLRFKDLSFGSGCAESRVPLQCFRNFGFRFRVFEGLGLVQDLRISARQSSRCAPAPVYGLDFRCGVRGGLVFKVHGLVYHSTLGLGVIKKKKRRCAPDPQTPNRSHLHSKPAVPRRARICGSYPLHYSA